jgi:hypothetical protein
MPSPVLSPQIKTSPKASPSLLPEPWVDELTAIHFCAQLFHLRPLMTENGLSYKQNLRERKPWEAQHTIARLTMPSLNQFLEGFHAEYADEGDQPHPKSKQENFSN